MLPLHLSIMFLRFKHIVNTYQEFILSVAEYYSVLWTDHILCVRVSADGHLSCFYFLAFMNNATVNIQDTTYMFYFLLSRCIIDHMVILVTDSKSKHPLCECSKKVQERLWTQPSLQTQELRGVDFHVLVSHFFFEYSMWKCGKK